MLMKRRVATARVLSADRHRVRSRKAGVRALSVTNGGAATNAANSNAAGIIEREAWTMLGRFVACDAIVVEPA
jgi:hypothetical protein